MPILLLVGPAAIVIGLFVLAAAKGTERPRSDDPDDGADAGRERGRGGRILGSFLLSIGILITALTAWVIYELRHASFVF